MWKKMVGALAILVLTLGFVVAEEFKGKVTKVSGTKITVENKKDNATKEFDIAGAKVLTQVKGEAAVAADVAAVKEKSQVSVKFEGAKVSEVIVAKKAQ